MRFDWLSDIVAIIDSNSLQEAAGHRLVTQPAFSRRVRAIEEFLGVEIVDRTQKPARASALVLSNADRFRRLNSESKQLIADLRRESRDGANRIAVASQHAITTSLAPNIVNAISRKGAIHIRLRSANRNECDAWLFARQVDISLTFHTPAELPDLGDSVSEHMILAEQDLIPVFKAGEARRLVWDYHHGSLPIVMYPPDVFLGRIISDQILPTLEARCVVKAVGETALTLAALRLSSSGVGLAWVPQSLAADEIANGTLADLRDVFPATRMHLVARRLNGPKTKPERETWAALKDLFEIGDAASDRGGETPTTPVHDGR